ncbi:MAG: hypothetical protein HOW73_19590 [Polyangiaceae bacterium]|nr:hypothetical protein [Polyangiaceae bacterium]
MKKLAALALALSFGCAPSEGAKGAANPTETVSVDAPKGAMVAALSASVDAAGTGTRVARLGEEGQKALERADIIVVGTLEGARIEAILEVEPPIYVHEFDVIVERRLSGGSTPQRVRASIRGRAFSEPFKNGEPVIVGLRHIEGTLVKAENEYVATWITPSDAQLEAAIASAHAVLPDGLKWSVAQVPPAKVVQWSNEYGDGLFQLTLHNDGAAAVEVRGLFEQGGDVQWANALTVRDESGRELRLPSNPMKKDAKPVVLAPGASISTVVDVKPFGIAHPAGGSRFYYSFGLGDLRTSSFFYYLHTLHGPMMGSTP